VTTEANATSSQITIVGGDMIEDSSSSRTEFISVLSGSHCAILGGRYIASETIPQLISSASSSADFTVDGAWLWQISNAVGGTQRGSVWINPFSTGYAVTITGFGASIGGNVSVAGNLSVSGAKNFKIDDPLDPTNKYLYHSSVESPDMLDLYNGTVVLDGQGEAWVRLPEYFEALNQDFQYQLTAVGSPAPGLYVAREISGNKFKIAGGRPRIKVSWQVTGIRHDAYASAHRTRVEEEKAGNERGRYMHPELFEADKAKGNITLSPNR